MALAMPRATSIHYADISQQPRESMGPCIAVMSAAATTSVMSQTVCNFQLKQNTVKVTTILFLLISQCDHNN